MTPQEPRGLQGKLVCICHAIAKLLARPLDVVELMFVARHQLNLSNYTDFAQVDTGSCRRRFAPS